MAILPLQRTFTEQQWFILQKKADDRKCSITSLLHMEINKEFSKMPKCAPCFGLEIINLRRRFAIDISDDVYATIICMASNQLISPQELVSRVVVNKLVM